MINPEVVAIIPYLSVFILTYFVSSLTVINVVFYFTTIYSIILWIFLLAEYVITNYLKHLDDYKPSIMLAVIQVYFEWIFHHTGKELGNLYILHKAKLFAWYEYITSKIPTSVYNFNVKYNFVMIGKNIVRILISPYGMYQSFMKTIAVSETKNKTS